MRPCAVDFRQNFQLPTFVIAAGHYRSSPTFVIAADPHNWKVPFVRGLNVVVIYGVVIVIYAAAFAYC